MKIALVQSPLVWGKLQENLQNFDKKKWRRVRIAM